MPATKLCLCLVEPKPPEIIVDHRGHYSYCVGYLFLQFDSIGYFPNRLAGSRFMVQDFDWLLNLDIFHYHLLFGQI